MLYILITTYIRYHSKYKKLCDKMVGDNLTYMYKISYVIVISIERATNTMDY